MNDKQMNDKQMNDKQIDTVLRTWMEEEHTQKPDRSRVVSNVVGQLRSARKPRRRWWPFRRRSDSLSTTNASDKTQPRPYLAPVGGTPTVTGRTQSMFSPTKAVTAGALVFAIGGVLLIAQPFEQGASVPGVATDAEPAAPVEVTGTARTGGCPASATWNNVGFLVESRGGYCQPTWEFDDARLNGTVKWYDDNDRYVDGSGLVVYTGAISIETGEGTWRERPTVQLEFPGSLEGDSFTVVMDGEGAYEDLTLAAQVDMTKDPWDIRGFIIDGGPPPPSENASTK